MPTSRRTVDTKIFPVRPGQHKRGARRGIRRRDDAKERREFYDDRFAWRKEIDTVGASAAERISKPWF